MLTCISMGRRTSPMMTLCRYRKQMTLAILRLLDSAPRKVWMMLR